MPKYKYEIEITENSQEEADMKMKGLSILAAKLTCREVDKMGQIVKNDPVKTAMAKQALGV